MATAAQRQARDLQANAPSFDARTLLDVGANVGHTVRTFREAHPRATIWAFEPISASFEELRRATADLPDIRIFNLALGPRDRDALMSANGTSDQNALVADDHAGPTEQVNVVAGDTFCVEYGIARIDYLKIDTEGADLEVLRGFHRMLGAAAIDVLCVEAGMNCTNSTHVPLARFQGYLEPLGYRVFKLYNQSLERRKPFLRRADVLFISPRLIDAP